MFVKNLSMVFRVTFFLFLSVYCFAQAPQKINFQSILRNSSGEVVGNKSVSLKIAILSGSVNGSSVYSETHTKTTDASGLISIQIGNGTVISGIFANIDWGNTAHFIKLEADFNGGSNYIVLGTQELMSVPYAIYATKTDTSVLNLSNRLATKLNATDTVSLSNRINANVNSNTSSSDTSLLNLTSRLAKKLNVTDTASLSNRIDLKLTKTDTASLSNRIDAKLTKTDTFALSNRIDLKLTKTDTASLSSRIDAKLTKTDTASLSNRIDGILTKTDTASLSNRIDAKLTKTDTAGMLLPYLRLADTMTMLANYRTVPFDFSVVAPLANANFTTAITTPNNTGSRISFYYADVASFPSASDSHGAVAHSHATGKMYYAHSGQWLEIANINSPSFTGTVSGIDKTMVGLPNVDNTSDLNKPISTATQIALITKVNTIDTANMLRPYLRDADTTIMLSTYLRKSSAVITDLQNQAALLSSYISLLASGLVDIDGNNYPVVKIGNQIWMKENLRVSRYRNGNLIPIGTNNATWKALTTGGRSWYSNDSTTYEYPYGNLYNWYAVEDSRGLCPVGWHVPSDAEWTTLTDYLGGLTVAGGRMKFIGSSFWNTPNTAATNESSFSALPGGYRNDDGSFGNIKNNADFWSATQNGSFNAWLRALFNDYGSVNRGNLSKRFGASVRCLRD